MTSPRVLIVAENASARFGGEAFLPLHYFRVLRGRGVPVWLLTHERVRAEMLEVFPDAEDRMLFVPDTRSQIALSKLGEPLSARVRSFTTDFVVHLISQRMQRELARELVAREGITVVHEPIPVSPRMPSAMYGLGAPVVIGPMNGGMQFPRAFEYMQSATEKAVFGLLGTGLELALAHRIMPGKVQAAALLVANPRTRDALPIATRGVRVLEIVENGVDRSRFQALEDRTPDPNVATFVFVGRLVDWKVVDVLIDALAAVRSEVEIRLEVFGDGPKRSVLERQVERFGLGSRVVFRGFLPQQEVATRLAALDCLVLPSVYECGGAVVLEAMALGLPVIATNWGGPADYLDSECGILVEPDSRESLVTQLADSMKKLAEDPEARIRMGRRGREKVEAQFDWEAKVDEVLQVYRSVANAGGAAAAAS